MGMDSKCLLMELTWNIYILSFTFEFMVQLINKPLIYYTDLPFCLCFHCWFVIHALYLITIYFDSWCSTAMPMNTRVTSPRKVFVCVKLTTWTPFVTSHAGRPNITQYSLSVPEPLQRSIYRCQTQTETSS